MSVEPIPPGYHAVTPYLIVHDAPAAIEFYTRAFHATELTRLADPAGRIHHAEIEIGDSRIMLADEFPERHIRGPKSLGGTAVIIHLYVEDVDAVAARATAAGARMIRPVADQFFGDRNGMLEDPFGHTWAVSTHVEDVSDAEVRRRAAAQMAPSAP
jgi:PhnB protein